MAANEVTWFDLFPGGRDGLAQVDRILAARVEVTPTGWRSRVGDFALQDDSLAGLPGGPSDCAIRRWNAACADWAVGSAARARIGLRYRRQERGGIRMLRRSKQRFRLRQ